MWLTIQRVFSGIQPTGTIHLGNYLGAIKKWKELQTQYSCIFSVVDLHSLTTENGRHDLKATTLRSTCALLASGIDPEASILFNQSKVTIFWDFLLMNKVSGHAELMWILSCATPMHKLNSMIQFKVTNAVCRIDKSSGKIEKGSKRSASGALDIPRVDGR